MSPTRRRLIRSGQARRQRALLYQPSIEPTDIFRALNLAKVRYLVVGGVAAIYHGVPRTTLDVDLAVRLEEGNLRRLAAAMKRIDFSTKVPADVTDLADSRKRRAWTQRKGMKVFSYIERKPPFRLVDVMVRPLQKFGRLYRQRAVVNYQGVSVPLIPVADLIRMKTGTGRLRDQEDVEYLRFAHRVRSRTNP